MYSGLIGCDDTPSVREPNSALILPTFTSVSVTRMSATLNWSGNDSVLVLLMLNTYNTYGVLNSGADTFQNANGLFSSAPLVDSYARLMYRGTGSTITLSGLVRKTSYTVKVYGFSDLRKGLPANGLIKLELAFTRQFTTSN